MSKERLKIGVVIDQLLPGGVQIAAIEEVKNLRLLGYQAELLILMRKKYSFQFEYLVKSIPHKYLSDSYPWPFRSTVKFPIFAFFSTLHLLSPFLAPRVIKEKTYDLLISHGTTTCFTTLTLWRKRKIPYIAIVHDPIVFILKKVYSKTPLRFFFPIFVPLSFYLERIFIKVSLATVIVSNVHREFICRNYQVEPVILTPGCEIISKIPPERGPLILAVSRWQKEKNPQFLLKLLKELPGAKLKIAGIWTKETELKNFKDQVKKLNLDKRVKIVPQFTAEELKTFCRQARVWVHPNFEAFGLGGLEAASNGVPIIIPAGSGVTDLFRHGVDGFFPKEITVSEYKKYAKRLLTNERLAYKMGRNAWLRVKKECSWEAHTKNLINLAKNQLENLHLTKITALEIGHAGKTGLSGGDRLFEEIVKRMPREFKIEVVTSPFGSKHWQEVQSAENLKINLITLNPNLFEKNSDPISVFFSYLIRMIQTSFLLSKQAKRMEILYSSTNILPDVLPVFITKLTNPEIIWIARIHHLIPPPHKREGKLIVNIVSYLMQSLALIGMRTKANLTIALNETLHNYLLEIGFPKNKLATLGAGIDFEQISKYQPQKVKSFEGIYLGRLHVVKGVFDTVDIWKQVVKEKKEARLAIIGAGPEYVSKKLKAKIKSNRLTKNIKILGFLPKNRVYDYLKSAGVFLFTDHEAGWGLAIAEAMACKLPVIGYDIGILGDVYKRGFKAVKIGDIKIFAQEIIRLLENKKESEKLAREALNQAKHLDWNKTTQKFINVIKPFITSW